jgi:hypothetical protein
VTHNEIIEAMANLCPNKEWTLVGDDYANLVWTSNGEKPTLEQIEVEITAIPQRKANQQAAAEANKNAAQAKLAALGLTADDLKALGLGNN